jgi:YjbR
MTVGDARGILLSFAGAEEGAHHGHPDYRVGGRIFGTLWPDKRRSVLRLSPDFAEALSMERPTAFKVVSKTGGWGWLAVDLNFVTVEEFHPLAEIAWERRK